MSQPSFNKIVGDNVKRLRLKAQISQSELGRRISLSRASVSNIENGRQNLLLDQASRVAQSLNTNINQLLPNSAEVTHIFCVETEPQNTDKLAQEFIQKVLKKGVK